MSWPPNHQRVRFAVRVVALIAVASLTCSGYEQHLDSEAIREAYFLGQRKDDVTAQFLARYVQSFPVPKSGPHIGRIEILTPYSQIVLGSQAGTIQGSVMDAEREYSSHPATFLVHVWIYSTPTFMPGPKWDEFWQELAVHVEQEKLLNPQNTRYVRHSSRGPGGTELELQFDATQIASAPITIDVSSPDGQHVEAKFDLSKLK
jgi:hypothetical protein